MTTNSQLSTTEPKTKQKQKQTKQTTRTGTESQKWRSCEGLSIGEGRENKQHKWQVENRQGEDKNSGGNVEAKELTSMTHGHELQEGNVGGRGWVGWSEGEETGQL